VKYFELIRIKHWAKNLFIFIPIFFAGEVSDLPKLGTLLLGFACFGVIASAIYILNDFVDIQDDRKHPIKRNRPLASGDVTLLIASIIFMILITIGFTLAYYINTKFAFVLLLYFILNILYCLILKNISILDIFSVAIGFVLRIKAGGILTVTPVSQWLIVMIFLLAMFLVLAKRRDDIQIKIQSGNDMRSTIKSYNLDFINASLVMTAAIIIVSYIIYTIDSENTKHFGTHRIYYTSIFVIAGIMRYLQLIYIHNDTGSPTKILYKDRFIQITILLWILNFYLIIYFKNLTFPLFP